MFETAIKMFQIFRPVNTRKAQSPTTLLKASVSHKHNTCFRKQEQMYAQSNNEHQTTLQRYQNGEFYLQLF